MSDVWCRTGWRCGRRNCPKCIAHKALTGLTASQLERLEDIAQCAPKLRGTLATQRALKRKNLVVFIGDNLRPTCLGAAVLVAMRSIRSS